MSIVTLMSSNENPPLTNFTPATSYVSGSSTSLATTNLTHLTTQFASTKRSWNLTVIISCSSAAVICLILLIYAVIKYRNRVEGSYKIDESQNFLSKTHPDPHDHSGKKISSQNHRQKSSNNNNNEQNGLDPKEWYV